MKVTHLDATNPTLKGHMVGATREEAQRLIASLAKQLGGHPLHEEFSDNRGEYFALALMGEEEMVEAELDEFLDAELGGAARDKTEILRQALVDGEVSGDAGPLDFGRIRSEGERESPRRLTKDELAAVVKPIDQQLPDEGDTCVECGAATDGSADLCDACWEPHRLRQESEKAERDRLLDEQAVPSWEDELVWAAAFFRSAALAGESVGPDHCDGCKRAYAALERPPDRQPGCAGGPGAE